MHDDDALAYYRMSTDDQKDSIAQQRRAVEAWCEANGIRIIAEFVDAGRTATTNDRPRLQELIAAAKHHNVSAVVCYDLDRLSRTDDMEAIAEVYYPLRKAGVRRLITPMQTYDLCNQLDRILIGMTQGLKNHAEALSIGKRTSRGRRDLW